ncbi:MAG: response regulator [Eubacteriales bacterium]
MVIKMLEIFIVEDELILLNSLSKKISDLNSDYKIVGTATNATDAISQIPQVMPDVVLTDIRMPGKDGLELINTLKPLFPSLLFVIISGYSDFTYAKRAISLSVVDYLLKPINMNDLRKCLETCIKKIENKKDSNHYKHPMMLSDDPSNWHNNSPSQQYYIAYLIYHNALNTNDMIIHPAVSFTSIHELTTFLSTRLSFSFSCFNGAISNEKIIMIEATSQQYLEVYSQLESFYTNISNTYHTTLFLSPCYHDIKSISTYIMYTRKNAVQSLILGMTKLYGNHNNLLNKNYPSLLTKQLSEKYISLIKQTKYADLEKELGLLFHDWIREQYPLYYVEKDLLFFLEYLRRTLFYNEILDYDLDLYLQDTIISSKTYTTLCENYYHTILDIFDLSITHNENTFSSGEIVKMAKEYFQNNLAENISLEEMSVYLHVSQTYLCKIFKEEMNCSPISYYTKIKIEKAKELLTSASSNQIKEISVVTGFSDPYYFSKVFKKYEGITPSQYHNLHKKT